jgi:hypothetical protein
MPDTALSAGMFPFGQPLRPTIPAARGTRQCFVLGAYPSALHVKWKPPSGLGRTIAALAVDNEPEPFWDGQDEEVRIARWREAVGWTSAWGEVGPVGRLNGSSGQAVKDGVLEPLGIDRNAVWLTDCLSLYHLSRGMAAAIDDVYRPLLKRLGLPEAKLASHPDEQSNVAGAEKARLKSEIDEANPNVVITLGNAALRVFRMLADEPIGPARLAADNNYGRPLAARIIGRRVTWYPVKHPGQRAPLWVAAHKAWVEWAAAPIRKAAASRTGSR